MGKPRTWEEADGELGGHAEWERRVIENAEKARKVARIQRAKTLTRRIPDKIGSLLGEFSLLENSRN